MRPIVPTLLALLLLPACRDRNDPDVVATPGEFTYEATLVDYSEVEEYRWNMPNAEAFFDLEVEDFSGEIRIEVFDDTDMLVYDLTLDGDAEDVLVEDQTAQGVPGEWTIIITFIDAFGDVLVHLY